MDLVFEFFSNIWDSIRASFEILTEWLGMTYDLIAPVGALVSVITVCFMVRLVRNFF